MVQNSYNLGTRPDNTILYQNGIAYIVIPKDVDRAKYIFECYKTSTVSIYSEHNGFSNRVPIDQNTLNFISFPEKPEEYGSAVSFNVDPVHKRPYLTGIFFKEDHLCDLQENQFKFKRELNGNVVELVGSPDGKYIGLNVIADKGGEVFLNVRSKDESGAVNVTVDGELNLTSLADTIMKQYGKLSIVTINREDETETTIEEHTSTGRTIFSGEELIHTDSFKINDGDQNFILGQLFKAYMKDFIKELCAATVTTQLGQMPLNNKEALQKYGEDDKIDEFLSKIGFIDK